MSLIPRGEFGKGWTPDADPIGGPADGLLRADNLVLDEIGALKLRRGSATVGTVFGEADVSSLYTSVLNGTRYRCAGAGDAVYVNGTATDTDLGGSGDVVFGSYLGEVFWTRGETHSKFDGTTKRTWGIAMTGGAPMVAPVTQRGQVLSTFDSTESPAWSAGEGSLSFVADRLGAASKAMKAEGDATSGRAAFTKTFASPQDCSTYNGVAASNDDLLQFYANVPTPAALTRVIIEIDVNDGTFAKDAYRTVFPQYAASGVVNFDDSYDVTGYQRRRIDAETGGRDSRGRTSTSGDTVPETGTWFTSVTPPGAATIGWQQWSVRRGDLIRRGSTQDKGWNSVKAIRFSIYYSTVSAATAISLDTLEIVGGSDRPLNGNYRHRYAYRRDDGTYVATSAPSDYSPEMSFSAGSADVTIPADADRDSQITEAVVYRMGTDLDNWYQVATADLTASTQAVTGFGQTCEDEAALLVANGMTPVLGYANYSCQDEEAFATSHSLTLAGPANFTCPAESADAWLASCSAATTFTVTGTWKGGILVHDVLGDRDALIQNLVADLDVTVPPDDVIGIAGPHYDRLWLLTATSVWPSRRLNPDGYATTQEIRVAGENERPLWICKALNSLFVGTTQDIYRIEGDGAEYPDGTFNIILLPLNIDHPPISEAFGQDGNSVVYLASDGWRSMTGLQSISLSGMTSLLYRGMTRHGVSPVNLATGRFRAAIGKGQLLAITPEGSDTTSSVVLYRAVTTGTVAGRWYRHVYPFGLRCIHREPDGTVLVGDSTGQVWELDSGTLDGSTALPVTLWTMADDFGAPYAEKVPADFRVKLDTGGAAASVALHLDGSTTANETLRVSQNGPLAVPLPIVKDDAFTHLQLRITATTSTFAFYAFGLQAIPKPAGVRVWDSGPLDLGVADLIWLRLVKVKVYAQDDLVVTPFFDDVEYPSVTVPVASAGTSVYQVPLGRGYKGKVPRLRITSVQSFSPYWLQFVRRNTVAQTDKPLAQIECGL